VKKFLLTVLVCITGVLNTLAVPAFPNLIKKIQPDGTEISVFLKGDEFVHWMESPDGYTLLHDKAGYVVYAQSDETGDLIPSEIKYGLPSFSPAQIASIPKKLRFSKQQTELMKKPWIEAEKANAEFRSANTANSAVGNKKALCILIDFPDNQFSFPKSDFEAMMNDEGYSRNGSKGSVKDYYKENSYGLLNLTVTVVGPFRMAKNYEEYLSNSAPDQRFMKRELVVEALNAADNSGVNFQEFADNNRLETFHIIFAGQGDETVGDGKRIWSHKSAISTYNLDGVSISTYSCSPEIYTNNEITNIGVICHELGHVFGAPDYYDTSGETGGEFKGTGNWDLMAGGNWNGNGTSPAHINMFQKILYGWVNPTALSQQTDISVMLNSAENPVAYTFQANADGEMYVLENRQKIKFDSELPGHGLLIWHVHKQAVGGYGNNGSHPQQLYPVCASSVYAIPTSDPATYGNINSAGTPFPGSSANANFTDMTVPQAFSWATNMGIQQPVTNITETNSTISFRFKDNSAIPVTNLAASTENGTVFLSWSTPASQAVTAYRIYRDGEFVQQIQGRNNTSITQLNVPNGPHQYCVSAVYNVLESEQSCVSVNIYGNSGEFVFPVTNVYSNSWPNKVKIGWDAPFTTGWFSISGEYATAYKWTSSATDYFGGILWNTEDLQKYDGFKLTAVQFIPRDAAAQYSIQVYNNRSPRELLYSQTIDATQLVFGNSYNTVALNQPVTINAADGLVIGIRYQNPQDYFFAVDGIEDNNERNILKIGNSWYTLPNANISRNYCFKAKFENQTPESVTYKIYRNYDVIGSTKSLSFTDENVQPETTYSYCVVAEKLNGDASEAVCTNAATQQLIPANQVNSVSTATVRNDVTVKWTKPNAHSDTSQTYFTESSGYVYSLGENDYIYAIRLTIDELRIAPSHYLASVKFYVPNVNSGTAITPENVDFTLKVWQGGSATGPGELIHEQSIPSFANGNNTVTLNKTINVDIYSNLWVGISVHRKNTEGSMYTLLYSKNGNVTGKGDMLYYNDKWTTGGAILSGFDANWNLQANFKPLQAVSFSISKNNEFIGSVNNNGDASFSFQDSNLTDGDYNYCVTAVYPTNTSLPACVTTVITDIKTAGGADLSARIYAHKNLVSVETDSSNPILEIAVINLQGVYLYSVKNIDSSKYSFNLNVQTPEVCIIRAVTKNGVASGKIILN
jgi:M6 family metalloprotease-like protein